MVWMPWESRPAGHEPPPWNRRDVAGGGVGEAVVGALVEDRHLARQARERVVVEVGELGDVAAGAVQRPLREDPGAGWRRVQDCGERLPVALGPVAGGVRAGGVVAGDQRLGLVGEVDAEHRALRGPVLDGGAGDPLHVPAGRRLVGGEEDRLADAVAGWPAYTVQPLKTRRKIASSLLSSPSLISTPKTAAWTSPTRWSSCSRAAAVDALGGAGLLVAAEVEQAVVARRRRAVAPGAHRAR
jgi:hypothetical protein